MTSLLRIIVGTLFLICVFIDNNKNTHASSQETVLVEPLTESRIRSKRFDVVETFLNNLKEAFLENAGEAKERFVRKMYDAIKDISNESKNEFIDKMILAIKEVPGIMSSILQKLVPKLVNFIWSKDGSSPGFQKLRQMVNTQAEKMGISGGTSKQCPGLMTSLVLVLVTQFWRIIAS